MVGVIVSVWSSCNNAIFWKSAIVRKTAQSLSGTLVVVIIKLQITWKGISFRALLDYNLHANIVHFCVICYCVYFPLTRVFCINKWAQNIFLNSFFYFLNSNI
jgi:hypothetical protein